MESHRQTGIFRSVGDRRPVLPQSKANSVSAYVWRVGSCGSICYAWIVGSCAYLYFCESMNLFQPEMPTIRFDPIQFDRGLRLNRIEAQTPRSVRSVISRSNRFGPIRSDRGLRSNRIRAIGHKLRNLCAIMNVTDFGDSWSVQMLKIRYISVCQARLKCNRFLAFAGLTSH